MLPYDPTSLTRGYVTAKPSREIGMKHTNDSSNSITSEQRRRIEDTNSVSVAMLVLSIFDADGAYCLFEASSADLCLLESLRD